MGSETIKERKGVIFCLGGENVPSEVFIEIDKYWVVIECIFINTPIMYLQAEIHSHTIKWECNTPHLYRPHLSEITRRIEESFRLPRLDT
jgi:hypothetical protein